MSALVALVLVGQLAPTSLRDTILQPLPCSSSTRPLDHLTTGPHSESDDWFAMDKFWHFSASFATVGAAYDLSNYRLSMKSPWPTGLSLGGTAVLGVSKEFYDLAGPTKHFSWKDLVADAAGIAVGYFAFIHRF